MTLCPSLGPFCLFPPAGFPSCSSSCVFLTDLGKAKSAQEDITGKAECPECSETALLLLDLSDLQRGAGLSIILWALTQACPGRPTWLLSSEDPQTQQWLRRVQSSRTAQGEAAGKEEAEAGAGVDRTGGEKKGNWDVEIPRAPVPGLGTSYVLQRARARRSPCTHFTNKYLGLRGRVTLSGLRQPVSLLPQSAPSIKQAEGSC